MYSSDDSKVGEVVSFTRDASGKVLDLHAGIGGFLGIGETVIRVWPVGYDLSNDRVILRLTAAQANAVSAMK